VLPTAGEYHKPIAGIAPPNETPPSVSTDAAEGKAREALVAAAEKSAGMAAALAADLGCCTMWSELDSIATQLHDPMPGGKLMTQRPKLGLDTTTSMDDNESGFAVAIPIDACAIGSREWGRTTGPIVDCSICKSVSSRIDATSLPVEDVRMTAERAIVPTADELIASLRVRLESCPT